MPNDSRTDTTAAEQTDDQKQCDVLGWATLGPSATITVPTDTDIGDITHDKAITALRDALQDRGFTAEQVEQMHIEVDYIEETFSP